VKIPSFLRRRPPVDLRFQQRECVIVPQTATRIALHADVNFAATSTRGALVIEDAHLVWRIDGGARAPDFRRSRWDRAVIGGRFRYPPQALAVTLSSSPVEVTLTFTDPLIPHGEEPPPHQSTLVLELSLEGGSTVRHDLWRVEMPSWDEAIPRWLA